MSFSVSETSTNPSSFTFTFDAFPENAENDLLFSLEVDGISTADIPSDRTTTVKIGSQDYPLTSSAQATTVWLDVTNNNISIQDDKSGVASIKTLSSGEILTNMDTIIKYDDPNARIPLSMGSTSQWYII